MKLHQHADFRDFINIVAKEKAIRDVIIEKDYWVTVALHALHHSEFKDCFIFKGGTSLSKGWNLIDRFSEDIDLLLIGDELGKSKKRDLMKRIEAFIGGLDGLEFDPDNRDNRSGPHSRTSCFKYKVHTSGAFGSILPYIKIEMGFRGGSEPNISRKIQSYLGEVFESKGQEHIAINIKAIELNLLAPQRTLVEKLYAIFSAYHSNSIVPKLRHYYDVYKLLELKDVADYIGTSEYLELKKNVEEFSIENWPDSPVPKMNELQITLAFNPSDDIRNQLNSAYNSSDLFYGTKPTFDEIIIRIRSFQSRF